MTTTRYPIYFCVKVLLLFISKEGFSQNKLNLNHFTKNRILSTFEVSYKSKPRENLNEGSIKMNIQSSSTHYLQLKQYIFKADAKRGGVVVESQINRIKSETDNGMTQGIYDSENVFERGTDPAAVLLVNRYDPIIKKPLKVIYNADGIALDTIVKPALPSGNSSIILSNVRNWSYLFIHVPEDFVWKEGKEWNDSLLVENILVKAQYKVISIQNGIASLDVKGVNSPQKTFSLRSQPVKIKEESTQSDSNFSGKTIVNIQNNMILEFEFNLNKEVSFDAMGQKMYLINEQTMTVKNQLVKD